LNGPRYFAALDPLRAGAALAVLVFHVIFASAWEDFPRQFPLGWLRGGWVGLDLFFVISGLVVGQSALVGFAERGGGFWRRFALNRMARIMPLYLLTAVVFVIAVRPDFIDRPDLGWQVLTHLLFIHNLWIDTAMSINPPSWSLGNEVQLYLVLALATPLIARSAGWRVAMAGIVLALCWRAAVMAAGTDGDVAMLQHRVYQMPGMVDSFALGVALALAWSAGRLRLGTAMGWVCVASGLAVLGIGSAVVDAAVDGSIWQDPWLAISLRSIVAVGAALVVLGCMQLPVPREAGGPWAWMARRAGDLSYGIYLWHAMVIELLLANSSMRGLALLLAVVVTSALLAEASWRWVERPLGRVWRQRRPSPPIAAEGG
jgi:peptidoglycan/LPS O-acetylase OafA/YrhL